MDEKDLRIFNNNMNLGCALVDGTGGYKSGMEKLLNKTVCVADSTFSDPIVGKPTAINMDDKTYVLSSNGEETLMRYENIQALYFLNPRLL
jgi:hypothetical protein